MATGPSTIMDHTRSSLLRQKKIKDTWNKDYKNKCLTYQTQNPWNFNYFRSRIQAPTTRFKRLINELDRTQAHIITRILTDRLPLKPFFISIGLKYDSTCDSCGVRESLLHFIFKCTKHSKHRKTMIRRFRNCWPYFSRFLHFNARTIIYGEDRLFTKKTPYGKINDTLQLKLWRILCEFVVETNHFPNLFPKEEVS